MNRINIDNQTLLVSHLFIDLCQTKLLFEKNYSLYFYFYSSCFAFSCILPSNLIIFFYFVQLLLNNVHMLVKGLSCVALFLIRSETWVEKYV